MKQGAIVNKIVMTLFFLAILLYLGGAAWKGLRNPYPTVRAYAFELDDTLETTGWLVREEQVLTGSGGIIRLVPSEGEKVAAGATVAMLYTDEAAMEREERLERLREEESQLAEALAAANDEAAGQGDRTGRAAAEALAQLRSAVESGDLTNLEEQTWAVKRAVYQQSGSRGDTAALSAALSAARQEISSLQAQSGQSVGRVTVEESGIFSAGVDGYESILTPDVIFSLSPADLAGLEGSALTVGNQEIAKLITDSTWYFVCPVEGEGRDRLEKGDKIPVRFSRDWSGEVTMTVEKVTIDTDGRAVAILSSNRFLSDTTLLRRQTVELVFARRTGIRIPVGALRVESEERTDPDTGETSLVKTTCVYVKVGVTAERKVVSILAQGEDFYLVEPVAQGESVSQQKKVLRAGDEVIIASGEIWDGKVLE